MLYMTDSLTASKMLNLNNPTQTGIGSRPNGSNSVSVQCGVKDNPTTQRLVETRH